MNATPRPVAAILDSRAFGVLARILLTFPYWGSGLAKLIDFTGARAEMGMFGLHPTAPFAIAVIITQLVGAGLVIHGRHAWLGAGWLAIFTALTIPIVHHFWNMDGVMGVVAFHTATEHVGMIGGLMLGAIQAHWARRRA
ncbi:DoxX family protein [Roseomonas populi]|uniref:DoxX family protein n=1 Tax=Roseomonas populi TaxID=3121582 RepID=A0ABT1WZQ8_9PROT|nr:DoxX family protein [Roseomonas pecuniae]MCR0981314.1 DoxX family protein [Roseomonas pecuniae]